MVRFQYQPTGGRIQAVIQERYLGDDGSGNRLGDIDEQHVAPQSDSRGTETAAIRLPARPHDGPAVSPHHVGKYWTFHRH